MSAGLYASIFLGLIVASGSGGGGGVDGVPQWKCKKHDIGNVDNKVVLFINYADCPPENCLLNATMLSTIAYLVRYHPSNQLVLLVDEGVEVPAFKKKHRIGQYLLVKNFGDTEGLHVDKEMFSGSAILAFDRLSTLVYKLPYSFEFFKKRNMTRTITQKTYNFIIKATIFAAINQNICNNAEVSCLDCTSIYS